MSKKYRCPKCNKRVAVRNGERFYDTPRPKSHIDPATDKYCGGMHGSAIEVDEK